MRAKAKEARVVNSKESHTSEINHFMKKIESNRQKVWDFGRKYESFYIAPKNIFISMR